VRRGILQASLGSGGLGLLLALVLAVGCAAPRQPAPSAGGPASAPAAAPAGGSAAAPSGASSASTALSIGSVQSAPVVKGGGTLVVASTAANIPQSDQCPTEGAEGFRFVGYQLFDALTSWDLSRSDVLSPLAPGLAESWDVSTADPTNWTFHLRHGVRFHDGTPFNADAVVFALDRVMNKDAAQYNELQAACSASYIAPIRDYAKLDDYTVRIGTKMPYSFLLYSLSSILIPSPTAVMKEGTKNFVNNPVGTGPFKFVRQVERQLIEMDANPDYFRGRPKLDKLIIRPIPEPASRLAALRAGEVQWAEVTPPESIKPLKDSGYQVMLNPYPQVWPWIVNMQAKPWDDKRVRQAANYAINREALCRDLLSGACSPASQFMFEGHPWYSADVGYKYDPDKARQLLAEAGYPNGFKTVAVVPSSGSGNMWPQPMNEYVQRNLREVGIDVELRPIEWNTMRNTYRAGFTEPDVAIYQYAWTTQTPEWIGRFILSTSKPPGGLNPGGYANPDVDALMAQAMATFDQKEQDEMVRQALHQVTEDAPWIWIVHDLNLRVLSPQVKGFVQPKAWYVNIPELSVE
jgi:peptide/nickel transport system substrate-binding protein